MFEHRQATGDPEAPSGSDLSDRSGETWADLTPADMAFLASAQAAYAGAGELSVVFPWMFEEQPTEPPVTDWAKQSVSGLLFDLLDAADPVSGFDAVERIGARARLVAAAQGEELREIAAYVRAVQAAPPVKLKDYEISQWVAAEVGAMLGLSPRSATNRVGEAVTFAERLPRTLDELCGGFLTLASARAIEEETSHLTPEEAAEVERVIHPKAREKTPRGVRAAARRAVARLDPERVRRRREKAVTERAVGWSPQPDGMGLLEALLPAERVMEILGIIDTYAQNTGGGPSDDRTMDARRADALVDLLRYPGRAHVSTQVRVTVSLTTLLGLDELPGELAGYGPITADVARALAADGTWRRLVTDPLSGAVVDYGTTRYAPPAELRERVVARDVTCRFPGCNRPAWRSDLDHCVPRSEGGPTNEHNLTALCKHHHRIKHMPGWSYTLEPDGTVIWTTPSKHRYKTKPPPQAEPNPAAGAEAGKPAPTSLAKGSSERGSEPMPKSDDCGERPPF